MLCRTVLLIVARFCFALVSSVASESTAHMRLRLHKLVEDFVGIHAPFGYEGCPAGTRMVKRKTLATGRITLRYEC